MSLGIIPAYTIPNGNLVPCDVNQAKVLKVLGNCILINYQNEHLYVQGIYSQELGLNILGPEQDDCITCEDQVIDRIKKYVYDPEISVNLYDLGLIYEIKLLPNILQVQMTLTSPACGMGQLMVDALVNAVSCTKNRSINVDIVFSPRWTMDRMSLEAKLKLGLM